MNSKCVANVSASMIAYDAPFDPIGYMSWATSPSSVSLPNDHCSTGCRYRKACRMQREGASVRPLMHAPAIKILGCEPQVRHLEQLLLRRRDLLQLEHKRALMMTATPFRTWCWISEGRVHQKSSTKTFCRGPEQPQRIATLPAKMFVRSCFSGSVRLLFLEIV